jgi:TetR/AcrR family transcriptional regulator, repressor for uid operon
MIPPAPPPAAAEGRARVAGAERRALILAVARTLFARQGYHGTSTSEIARAACCAEAILYRHFRSKQALFAATLAAGARIIKGRLEEAMAGGGEDPFGALADAYARLAEDPDVPEVLRLRSLAVTMVDEPEIRATLEELAGGFRATLADAVRASQASGAIRGDVAPEHAVALFAGIGFLAAFDCALAGESALVRLAPAAGTLVDLLRPPSTPTAPEAP